MSTDRQYEIFDEIIRKCDYRKVASQIIATIIRDAMIRIDEAESKLAAIKANDGWIDRRVQEPPKYKEIDVWDDAGDDPKTAIIYESGANYNDVNGEFQVIVFTYWRNRPQKPKALS